MSNWEMTDKDKDKLFDLLVEFHQQEKAILSATKIKAIYKFISNLLAKERQEGYEKGWLDCAMNAPKGHPNKKEI